MSRQHTTGCPAPINLAEYRSLRRARAGRPAPVMRFAKQLSRSRMTPDEFTESQQARLRAAEDLACRPPFRAVFAWGAGLALTVALGLLAWRVL